MSSMSSAFDERPSSLLLAAVERLEAARSVADVAEALRLNARGLIGSDGVALVLRDGDHCHYVDEDAVGPLWKGQKFPMAACISGWSMLKRQTVCIADILQDRRIPQDLYADTFVRSLVMTPICNEPPIGALGAYWAHGHAATPAEVATVEALARAAGLALSKI